MSRKIEHSDSEDDTGSMESMGTEEDMNGHDQIEIVMGGYLLKKGWEKWSKRWFLLYEDGVMLYFKRAGGSPSGFVDFRNLLSLDEFQHEKEKYVAFTAKVFHQSREITHYFAADDAAIVEQWAKYIVQVGRKEAEIGMSAESDIDFNASMLSKKRRFPRYADIDVTSYFSKGYKKNLGRTIMKKFAKSNVGKSALKNMVSPDGFVLIEVLGSIIESIRGEGEGKVWEDNVITLGTEAMYLIQDKVIEKDALLNLRDPVFNLWSDTLDMLELSFAYDKHKLRKMIRLLNKELTEMLSLHQTAEKVEIIRAYGEFFARKETIQLVYRSDEYEDIREIIRSVLRKTWEETFYRGLE